MDAQATLPHRLPGALQAAAPAQLSRSSSLGEDLCRICWDTAGDGPDEALLSPCGCSGSSGHIHYRCLVRWVGASLHSGRPGAGTCELCRRPFFGASPWRHALLLTTAVREVQLDRLYRMQQQPDDALPPPPDPAPAADAAHAHAGAAAGAAAVRQTPPQPSLHRQLAAALDGALVWYWRVVLRTLLLAMLPTGLAHVAGQIGFSEAPHAVGSQGGGSGQQPDGSAFVGPPAAAAGPALPMNEAGVREFFLTLGMAQVVSHSLPGLSPFWQRLLAPPCHFWALGQMGEDVSAWLAGQAKRLACMLFWPLNAPYFVWCASALAGFGALRPGTYKAADGLRAAAALPLHVAQWAVSQPGRQVLGRYAVQAWGLLVHASTHLRLLLLGGLGLKAGQGCRPE